MLKIRKGNKDDDFRVNLDDERFAAMKSSHHFAIDPSVPEYKETVASEQLRSKQAALLSQSTTRTNTSHPLKASSENLVSKIKDKADAFKQKKEQSKLFRTKDKNQSSKAKGSENVNRKGNPDNSKKRKIRNNVDKISDKKVKKKRLRTDS